MRLLVFDDDAAVGRLIVRIATAAGFDAGAVTTAEAFQQSLRQALPQVIALDLQLGGTDGVEQMRFLADRQYAGSLIIFTGFNTRVLESTGTVASNLGLNVAATLTKPMCVETLERVLERVQAAWQPMSVETIVAAIRNDEMSLDFQPIVSRRPRTLKKLEALIRWDHPILGRVPPGDFLRIAEANTEAIHALTEWVVGAATDAYLVLRELGVCVQIAVNVSPRNFHDLAFADRLARRLMAVGVPESHLCLEITETAASQDTPRMTEILARVRLKGIQLAIDDFGTGYSSLKLLRHLPFSEIKIDQSFVADMATARDARVIVKSIIDLAANMEMDSVAEGVETEETARLLEEMNVGAIQGYLIAPPMPIEAVAPWLSIWLAGDTDVIPGQHQAPAAYSGKYKPGDIASASTRAARSAEQPATESVEVSLTPRQREVMELLSVGCSVKEIARKLEVSAGTVKVHLSLAYTALRARNRVEAINRLRKNAAA